VQYVIIVIPKKSRNSNNIFEDCLTFVRLKTSMFQSMINPSFCKHQRKDFLFKKTISEVLLQVDWRRPLGTSLQASSLNGADHVVKLTLFSFKTSSFSCELCIIVLCVVWIMVILEIEIMKQTGRKISTNTNHICNFVNIYPIVVHFVMIPRCLMYLCLVWLHKSSIYLSQF
jgi:hypothetical protein